MRIGWSEPALADLDAIHDYIARDSPIYAGRFVTRIVRATEPLADFPELGRRVLEEPEQENLRELVVQSYRVIYRIETERIRRTYGVPGRPGGVVDRQDATAIVKTYPLWVGTPEDIAGIALFLASDESRMITGAAIPADGGRSAY